jgi:hypothetical protein
MMTTPWHLSSSCRCIALLLLLQLGSQPLSPTEIVVEDGCTLVDAVTAANTDTATSGCPAGSGADEIVLTDDVLLTDSVDGENGLPVVTSTITLRGNGFTILRDAAAPDFRLIETSDDTDKEVLTLEDVILRNGSLPAGNGGGIAVGLRDSVVLRDVVVSGNLAERGGGIYHSYDADLAIYDSRISGNTALGAGGGLFKAAGYLEIVSSTISGNSAEAGGGISTNDGWQHGGTGITNSTISGNSATTVGGLLSSNVYAYTFLTNSTVSGNSDTELVGGIHGSGQYSALWLTNTTVTGNSSANGAAGGLTFYADWYFIETENTVIAGNTGGNCSITGTHTEVGANFDDDGSCGQSFGLMTGLDPALSFNGGPTRTHALLDGSSAIDAGGECPTQVSEDQRGRPRDSACDSGSYEFGGGLLSLGGQCPGTMTVTVAWANPDSELEIFQGPSEGVSQVPSGVCAGTELGITTPVSVGILLTDASGSGTLELDLAAADCAQFLQGVDAADCATSNVLSVDSCNPLSLQHTGEGDDPVAAPDSSPGCPAQSYLPGELISLQASADSSWEVGGWSGTDDDASTSEMNAVTMPAAPHVVTVNYERVCHRLIRDAAGAGRIPEASPLKSAGCLTGEYLPGEPIQLFGALPDTGWAITGWIGTDDDSSTDTTNTLTMPDQEHVTSVVYERVCFDLTRSHTGSGKNPFVSIPASDGCVSGAYMEGEVIGLTANPDPSWVVDSWTGSDDDASTSESNTLTMPAADHDVAVNYVGICYPLTREHVGPGADPVATPLARGTIWSEQPVGSGLDGASSVFAADIDGDQDMDLVSAADLDDDITFWENTTGDGDGWAEHTLATTFRGPLSVVAADIDGDGDLDVLATAEIDDQVAWWENVNGDGATWTKHIVTSVFDGAAIVGAADLDGDFDLDIVASSANIDRIFWWENLQGDGSSWSEHDLSGEYEAAWSVFTVDMDGDSDIDVLSTARREDVASWWENVSGDGSSWIEHTIATDFIEPFSAVAGDLDGDSDIDVVLSGLDTEADVVWLENLDGAGTTWTEHVLDNNFDDARSALIVDLDSDLDLDILVTSREEDTVVWWENENGDATSFAAHILADDFDGARWAVAADVDGDSSPDVVGAAYLADRVTWWRNVYDGTCPADSFRFDDRLSLTATPDPGAEIAGWAGTDDDASTATTNAASMPPGAHTVSVTYMEGDPPAVALSVAGTCPGDVDVSVSTAAPNQDVVIFAGSSGGSTVLASGGCAGTELDLGGARQWRTLTTDSNGDGLVSFTAGAAWCSRSLQAIDRSCSKSGPAALP